MEKKLKILHLCSKEFWDRKMSRVRFHSIEAIGRHPEIELIKSGPGWNDFESCKKSEDRYKPDLIVWYKPMQMPDFHLVKTPTCLRYNEMWDINYTSNEIILTKSKLIICHHHNDIKNYDHIKEAIFYHNPHCAEKLIFKDYGMTKDIDIQLIGVISPEFYPLRSKFHEIISTRIVPKYGIKYRILQHPGYRIQDVKSQVINYAKQLNRAKINVTCGSKYRYALAKYSEVPMCKSLLIADMPDENKDWYKKWLVYVNKDAPEDLIINHIMIHFDPNIYNEWVKKGYDENIKYRTQEKYAERFVNIIKDFLNENFTCT